MRLKLTTLVRFGVGSLWLVSGLNKPYIREKLESGQIELSDSPWASPVVLVTTKMGLPVSALTTASLTL